MSHIPLFPVAPSQVGISVSASVEASFMEALRSNHPTSKENTALFTEKILSKAAENICTLDDQISQLTERRDILMEALVRWRGAVSPIRSFPNEILTEIFMYVCRGFEVGLESEGPCLLRRVCARWKDLVLGTPALWANFSLDTRQPTFMGAHDREMLRRAVSLSASSSLTFSYHADAPRDTHSEIAEIFAILLAQAHRWVEASLVFAIESFPLKSLDELRGRLPLLESLYLSASNDTDLAPHDYPPIRGFAIAPRLTRVTLEQMMFETIDLPLHQLSYLAVSWYILDGPGLALGRLHYLDECPYLQEFHVVHDSFPLEEEWFHVRMLQLAPISPLRVHKGIRVLHVSDDRFIRSISLPALAELYIVGRDFCPNPYPSATVEAVVCFLQQSKCPLKTLSVVDDAVFADTAKLLDSAPQLERLELKYMRWEAHCDTYLISLLSYLSSTPNVVPNLRVLRIHVQGSDAKIGFIGPQLCSFISSRFAPPLGEFITRIEKIEISLELPAELVCTTQREVFDTLKGYKEQGLDISISALNDLPSTKRLSYLNVEAQQTDTFDSICEDSRTTFAYV